MATNATNATNAGSSVSVGNDTAASGGWSFADRIDLPFVTEVTSSGAPIAQERMSPPAFPERKWSANWFSWRVLVEFTRTDWLKTQLPDWTKMPGFTSVDDEIHNLVRAAQDERADALGEILSQADEFISYFLDLLTAAPTSYPATNRVLQAANLVGLFVVMHWKAHYKRPRATQLCPALLPPIPVPGHASYPSGHSTQAHLVALCMQDVLRGLPVAQRNAMQPMGNGLWVLAGRIARNREIAGMHYPSDTAAGVMLAERTLPYLRGMKADSAYKTAVKAATEEWKQ